MGVLVTKITELFSDFRELDERVPMIGMDSAGKTTLLYRLKWNETVTTIPTIGFNVETVTPVKGLTMTVWDVGGGKGLWPLWRHYCQNCSAIIYVVDSSDQSRFEEARYYLWLVLNNEDLGSAPLLVLANKQDLAQARPASQVADALELHKLKSRRWHAQSTCATTGDGIFEGMELLSEMIREFKNSSKY